MDELIGVDTICDYLKTTRKTFFKKRRETNGTDLQAPIFTFYKGIPPQRTRGIWTTKELILSWWASLGKERG
jgi:hypothetical protein